MWWKRNQGRIIALAAILVILAAAFWYGGSAPGLQGWTIPSTPAPAQTAPAALPTPKPSAPPPPAPTGTPAPVPSAVPAAAPPSLEPAAPPSPEPEPQPSQGLESRPGGAEGGMSAEEKVAAAAALAGGPSAGVEQGSTEYSQAQGMVIDAVTGKDKYLTDPVPEGRPVPVEPQDAVITDRAYTCTLSISCATILDNMDWLDPEKVELVPGDGWILFPTEVTFYEGESVFNVLQRTCKQKKIHMEFSKTPMYNSAYIEGIHNLYEFDCGELSGWMYKVNGWFPNYGCSRYALRPDDVVEWVYTCSLGVDVGGFSAIGG